MKADYYPFGLKHKGYNNQITGRDSNYGYVGFEEQNELGLDWLDFGARNFDPSLGRWFSVDNMAEKYYEFSPYHYSANNPILYYDFNGEDFTLFYMDENDKEQKFVFRGKETRHSDKFIQKFLNAYHYNVNNGGGVAMEEIATNSKMDVLIEKTDGITKNRSSRANTRDGFNTIYFNPELGTETDNRVVLSPATLLEHKSQHAVDNENGLNLRNQRKDKEFETEGERRAITIAEQHTAECNGEVSCGTSTRENHYGLFVVTEGVTSTKVNIKKTKAFTKKMKKKYSPYPYPNAKKYYYDQQ